MNGDDVSIIQFERGSFYFYKKILIKYIFQLLFNKECESFLGNVIDFYKGKLMYFCNEKMVILIYFNILYIFGV